MKQIGKEILRYTEERVEIFSNIHVHDLDYWRCAKGGQLQTT